MIPLRDNLPTRRFPFVTYGLVMLNVVAFLVERALLSEGVAPDGLALAWGVVPRRLLNDPSGQWWTVLSSMFLHDPLGLGHIAGNMLFLWIFGDNVEDHFGHGRFALFYVACGVGAAAVQVAAHPHGGVPMLGASGAISGVLGAYGVLYPRAPVTVLNPILPLWFFLGLFLVVPAWLVIAEYFVLNVWSAWSLGTRSSVAFHAHVGGFVTGFVMTHWALRRGRKRRAYDPWHGWRPPMRR